MKHLLLLTLFFFFTSIAKAQPPARILFNSSFEEPDIGVNYTFVNENLVPGWDVANPSDPVVEFWSSGFNGVISQDGEQHIELNANQPSDVYLDVCLLENETVTLTFHHRARGNPSATDINTMELEALNQVSGNIVVSNITATNVNDAVGNTWAGVGTIGTVTTNSFQVSSPTYGWTRYTCDLTNTGSSGTCRIVFSGVGGGSFGNFIDNVQIGGLNPLTEFSSSIYSDDEGTGGNQPMIIINGRVDVASTIDILIQNGTATNPTDYTTTGTITVNIPVGDYDGTVATGISIPLGIINDNDDEPNETITLQLVVPSETGNIRINDANCDNLPVLDATYTIIDDDDLLPVVFKEWKLDDNECGKVKLSWTTTQELNSNYFEIQFSQNNKDWKTIHKVLAKGTSNYTNEYSFTHHTEYKAGYYRLNQVDFDGHSFLTHILSSKQNCDMKSSYFKFYPNPKSSTENLILEFYSVSPTLSYSIFDALGREIRVNTLSVSSNQFTKQSIQENLSKGMYLIKFWQQNEEIFQTKLIVK